MRLRHTTTDDGAAAIAQLGWLDGLPRDTAAHCWIVLKLYRVPTRAALYAYLAALEAGDSDEANRLHAAWPLRTVDELRAAQARTGMVW